MRALVTYSFVNQSFIVRRGRRLAYVRVGDWNIRQSVYNTCNRFVQYTAIVFCIFILLKFDFFLFFFSFKWLSCKVVAFTWIRWQSRCTCNHLKEPCIQNTSDSVWWLMMSFISTHKYEDHKSSPFHSQYLFMWTLKCNLRERWRGYSNIWYTLYSYVRLHTRYSMHVGGIHLLHKEIQHQSEKMLVKKKVFKIEITSLQIYVCPSILNSKKL